MMRTRNGAKHAIYSSKEYLPVLDGVERVFVGDVIHQYEAHCTAIVRCRYRPVAFLAGSILDETRIS